MQIVSPCFGKRMCLCSKTRVAQHGLAVLIASTVVMKAIRIIMLIMVYSSGSSFFYQSISKHSKKGSITLFCRWRNSGTER